MFISISLALIALCAGMLLLAKTNKDNLGLFFKSISFFFIIGSFLVMILSAVFGFTRMMFHHRHNEKRSHRHHKKHHKFHGGHWQRNHYWNSEEGAMSWHGENNDNDPGGFEPHEPGEQPNGFEHHRGSQGFDHGNGQDNRNDRVERRTKHLTEQLKLTPDQTSKLQEIFKTSLEKEKEIRQKSNGDWEAFKKGAKENRQQRTEAIKKILTPEQLKVFNENNARKDGEHNQD